MLSPDLDNEFDAAVFGDARSPTDRYDHHYISSTPPVETRGTVRAVEAAFCEVARNHPVDPRLLVPVDGTGTLEERRTADGREPETAGRHFVGYVVDLEVPDGS